MLGRDVELFRTGWFVESVISAAAIVLVVRTRGPLLGCVPLPTLFLLWLLLILMASIVSAEQPAGGMTAAGNTGNSCRSGPHPQPRLASTAAA